LRILIVTASDLIRHHMYPQEWIQWINLKKARRSITRPAIASPVVLSLGLTSLLTDISSEMVNSLLPAYLVLHLHLSPLQFGVVDGLYNGFAAALCSLAAGYIADRSWRHRNVALVGYGLSCVCKLLLLAAGAVYGWILIAIGLDRLGKGIRTAPRDALISLAVPAESLAMSFGVHRAMDACGALLGPIFAFVLLAVLPGAFDAVWVTSFAFAALGVAALWLFVPASATRSAGAEDPPARAEPGLASSARFRAIAICAAMLGVTSISDGFVYLLLQQKSAMAVGYFPLFYVLTAFGFMVFAIPVGWLADRVSRFAVFLGGYAVLTLVYAMLYLQTDVGVGGLMACLSLLALHYAATQGILMAMASEVTPSGRRAIGMAIIATGAGLGKLVSSIAFGAMWQGLGAATSVLLFGLGMIIALFVTWVLLRSRS
jgi:MFS family permease